MREITFRGKTKDGMWVEGDLLTRGVDYETAIRVHKKGYNSILIAVEPETVGQYTGLKDKNGNPIYEGHIVKCRHIFIDAFEKIKEKNPRKSYGKEIEEMAFGDFQCRYWRNYVVSFHDERMRGQNGSDTCYLKQSYIRNHEVEIIGNIHDNPELMEVR